MEGTGPASRLLRAWGRGDLQTRDELVPVVYRELRRRAGAYLRRERPDHTLQPTALVHEAYLRLQGPTAGSGAVLYDVMPNGRRFLVSTRPEHAEPPITVVLNWVVGLRK
jgi:ECF sigma factor